MLKPGKEHNVGRRCACRPRLSPRRLLAGPVPARAAARLGTRARPTHRARARHDPPHLLPAGPPGEPDGGRPAAAGCPEFVVAVFALMRLGAIPVLAPTAHRETEIAHLVAESEAAGYVGPSLRRVFTLTAPGEQTGGFSLLPGGALAFPLHTVDEAPVPDRRLDASDVAFFLPSGGGTATPPRLVGRTHDDYAYQLRATAEPLALGPEDVYLATPPAESTLTLGCPGILGTLAVGGTVVLLDDPAPEAAFHTIAREGVTVTTVTPGIAARWLDALDGAEADLASLRVMQIGGGTSRLDPAWPHVSSPVSAVGRGQPGRGRLPPTTPLRRPRRSMIGSFVPLSGRMVAAQVSEGLGGVEQTCQSPPDEWLPGPLWQRAAPAPPPLPPTTSRKPPNPPGMRAGRRRKPRHRATSFLEPQAQAPSQAPSPSPRPEAQAPSQAPSPSPRPEAQAPSPSPGQDPPPSRPAIGPTSGG
ncbi:AMP-binding protein [Streptomyces sp. CA-142005]|uniref:AMP-binding protein n=1 Tax=Streptomyces sp. CA-142005 TaxID=3240052 RepID=UPI003D9405CF